MSRAGVLAQGPNGRPVLREAGHAYEDGEIEARMQERIHALLQRGGRGERS